MPKKVITAQVVTQDSVFNIGVRPLNTAYKTNVELEITKIYTHAK